MSAIDDFQKFFIDSIVDPVWTLAIIVMVICSIIFFKAVGLSPFTLVKDAIQRLAPSKSSENPEKISTFGAFCNSLCTHVGTGNIIGVAVAMSFGFGALFWMWIFGLIAASLVFVECVIGQLYKEKMGDGVYRGGPAYFIRKGLKNKRFAIVYAVLSISLSVFACGFFVTNMSSTLDITFNVSDNSAMIIVGLVVTFFVALIIMNRVTKITKITSKLIPAFCLLWILICIVSILFHIDRVPWAFGQIMASAFDPKAIISSVAGSLIIVGFKRGAFCSDAGHGQISPVASEADNSHPCIQGFVQSFGLFFDIFVICTLSALLVIICGGNYTGSEPAEYVLIALKNGFLGDLAPYIFLFIMIMLGISSSTGNFLCAESNLHEITDSEKGVKVLRVIFIAVMIFSILMPVTLILDIADFFTAVLSFVNCFALLLLLKYVSPIVKDYKKKRKTEEEPRFDLSVIDNLDTNGITAWPASPDDIGLTSSDEGNKDIIQPLL